MKNASTIFLFVMLSVNAALSQETIAETIKAVEDACRTASDEGDFTSITTNGNVDGSVRLRLFGTLDADGYVEFTEEEWTGLRQVVSEDRLADNIDYRNCVRELTPSVLGKLP